MTDRLLGGFEQVVLLVVLHLPEDDAYGVPIRSEITRRTGRRVSRGALYTSLERLESKGYVSSRMGGATAERGGRAKRLYTVTAAGIGALRLSRETLVGLWSGLETILEGTPS